jgi:predicted homoserine dehydrogenase-like protein
MVDVVATAKTDLARGQELDTLGGYCTYGLAENSDTTSRHNLLPVGLAEGCIMKRDVVMDEVLTYDDVILPPSRLSDRLRLEQEEMFNLRRET